MNSLRSPLLIPLNIKEHVFPAAGLLLLFILHFIPSQIAHHGPRKGRPHR